jgi:flagellar hook-associated protein 1 FlgK
LYSSFFGIEIAKRALFAQQRALENVSHNVANANTPGYSRQRPVMEATFMKPYGMISTGAGVYQPGTGVKVADIVRIRDDFADMQYRDENSSLGQWSVQADILRQVEAVFNEPSDIGVSSVLTQFWQALEELSKNPEAIEIRETVKERAVTLADTVNHTAIQLSEIIDDVNFKISVKVNEINTLARQIAALNSEIQQLEIRGVTASDLRDKRDLLLDQLSKIVDIKTYENENGIFTVNVGGTILVKGSETSPVTFDTANPDDRPIWKDYNLPLSMKSGELKGLLDLREKVSGYFESLRTFAEVFVQNFNEIHKEGYDLYGEPGREFFMLSQSDDGSLMFVSPDILSDVRRIAAAETSTGVPGDNRNALKLADLRYAYLERLNGTIDDYYGALISNIGIDSQEALRMAEAQEYMVSQLDERRKEISSVSIDEEMTKMIMYQHAYNAAARVVTALDEMLEIIISRMGVAGR